jgi:hypothetical protein
VSIANIIEKLHSLPEQKKKIIFFPVVIASALVMMVFGVIDTKHNIAKINQGLKGVALPEIDFKGQAQDMPRIDFQGLISKALGSDLSSYENANNGFSLVYPSAWVINSAGTDDNHLGLFRKIENDESAGIHLEVISKTQNVDSAAGAADAMAAIMKEVAVSKQEVAVGEYPGYELIGTLCVSTCDDAQKSEYGLFSVIYFSTQHQTFEIQYAEGAQATGWKTNKNDWKYYEEFKNIIGTFISIQ